MQVKQYNLKQFISPSLHLLTWTLLGFLLLFYIPLTWRVEVPAVFWIWQCLVLIIMMLLFYTNARLIVPRTILKNRTAAFIVWAIAITLALQIFAYFYTSETRMSEKVAAALSDKGRKKHLFDSFIFTLTLIVMGISTSWSLLQSRQRSDERHQRLEQEKTIAELAMLKAQINPHFFFNTLNNIYSLSYINVEDSRSALHTLSRMMRYLLYGTEAEKSTLVKEVSFLRDYISLMRLRTDSKLKLLCDIPQHLKDCPIVPMLMTPFVENAFKHGVGANGEGSISITLKQEGEHLTFQVTNSITEFIQHEQTEGGIGMINTARRLQLMYPGQHKLIAGINSDGNYEIILQLQLQS